MSIYFVGITFLLIAANRAQSQESLQPLARYDSDVQYPDHNANLARYKVERLMDADEWAKLPPPDKPSFKRPPVSKKHLFKNKLKKIIRKLFGQKSEKGLLVHWLTQPKKWYNKFMRPKSASKDSAPLLIAQMSAFTPNFERIDSIRIHSDPIVSNSELTFVTGNSKFTVYCYNLSLLPKILRAKDIRVNFRVEHLLEHKKESAAARIYYGKDKFFLIKKMSMKSTESKKLKWLKNLEVSSIFKKVFDPEERQLLEGKYVKMTFEKDGYCIFNYDTTKVRGCEYSGAFPLIAASPITEVFLVLGDGLMLERRKIVSSK